MTATFEDTIKRYFDGENILSRERLIMAITEDFPQWSISTINVYLSKLKKSGVLKSPARGFYTLSGKEDFSPAIDPELKKLANKISKALPYVTLCAWDTRWLNTFMRYQPFRYYTVIEVERDAMQQVFQQINEISEDGYMDPNTLVFDLYVSNADHAIIIRPLVTEAPTENEKGITVPSLEKLLVDMLADKDLFAAQQGELHEIFADANTRYNLNYLKMKRYAVRRNREKELKETMNTISAENEIFAKT